jgi:hypothetical protein
MLTVKTVMTRTGGRWAWAWVTAAVIACSGVGLGGCAATRSALGRGTAQTWNLNVSPKMPAANGKVTTTNHKDGNLRLAVEVEHLALPERAFEGATTYVVWLIPQGADAQSVGVLNVGEDLKARLDTTTPYRTFEVVVTAEVSPDVTRPSDNRVLYTKVQVPA